MIGAAEPRTPVTVVAGPGAGPGKAALFEHLAHDAALARSIVFTAGRSSLVAEQPTEGETPVRLGCACCTVQGDLQRSLRALLPRARRGDVAHVLVDAESGSDPMAVLTTLITDPVLAAVYRIGGIVTVVDGADARCVGPVEPRRRQNSQESARFVVVGEGRPSTALSRSTPQVVDGRPSPTTTWKGRRPTGSDLNAVAVEPADNGMVGVADDLTARRLILLADRVIVPDRAMAAAVRRLNPAALVAEGLPDARFVLRQDRFAPEAAETEAAETAVCPTRTVVAVTLPDPVNWAHLVHRLNASVLRPSSAQGVERLFGVLHVAGEGRPVAIDAVRHHLAAPWLLPAWPAGSTLRSRLIFVGAGLDAASIEAALTHA